MSIRAELWDVDSRVGEEWDRYGQGIHFHLGDGFLGAKSLLGEVGPALLHIDSPRQNLFKRCQRNFTWSGLFLMSRIVRVAIGFVVPVAVYSMIFVFLMGHEGQMENADLMTAVYWVVITMTTVGYGEVIFYSSVGRIFSVLVSVSGIVIFFAVAFPVIVTPWIESMSRGLPAKAPPKMKDHIIICGYNPVVETLTENLKRQDVPFVVVERRYDIARGIYRKYPTVWGDPSEKEVLLNANIRTARLVIANERDELNADIVLTVREISGIEVVALAEDVTKARFLSYAGASRIISPKMLLGNFIAQIISPPRSGVFPGAFKLFGGLLVEFPIYPGSPLIGRKVNDELLKGTGANVVGIWQRGRFVSSPGQEEIRSNSVLMAVGELGPLNKLRELVMGAPKRGRLIIIGYGDVGRRIFKVLSEKGIEPVVVDLREICDVCSHQVVGDGTSEEVLEKAGVRDAAGILIMLNDDTNVVFSTLLARSLNRGAFILARANHVRSSEKIYRAGADYVATVPIVASHILVRIAEDRDEQLAMIYEDLELIQFRVGQRSDALSGKALGSLHLSERVGCTVVAIERDGVGLLDANPGTIVKTGDLLAVVGSPKSIDLFGRAYGGRLSYWRRIFGA